MKVDLAGRVRNTQLSPLKALLPLFEAVINSFQSIEDAGASDKPYFIHIDVERNKSLFEEHEIDGEINGFTISDNGIGFNETNLRSFFTSDSLYKSERGGKGVGRFMWLKAFAYADVNSHFQENGKMLQRSFTFNMQSDDPPKDCPTLSDQTSSGSQIRLVGIKSTYSVKCPQSLEEIAHRLIEHCLHYFLKPNTPDVVVRDKKNAININQYFADTFTSNAKLHKRNIADYTFNLTGLIIRNPTAPRHRVLYTANWREVHTEYLERFMPNLHKPLQEADGTPYIYLIIIEGEYLDQHVNSERTRFDFPQGDDSEDGSLLEEISVKDIRDLAIECIAEDLSTPIATINDEKKHLIESFINTDAPEYRPLLSYLDEFIDSVEPGLNKQQLDTVLHKLFYLKQAALRQENKQLVNDIKKQSGKPEDYEARISKYLKRENEFGKASLARYIVHRRVILDFLEESLRANEITDEFRLEKIIHQIVYPMQLTSEEVEYEQQNLWLIDERLTFHSYLASDKPMDSMDIFDSNSKNRPDILVVDEHIYDRAITFTDDQTPHSSMSIIEFKKPGRNEYPKEDPVDQVYRLIDDIQSGKYKDRYKREIKIQSNFRVYGYVICDITPAVKTAAKRKNMTATPDGEGYFVYNSDYKSYVEIISYDKLLKDAQKRNQVLFHKLCISK